MKMRSFLAFDINDEMRQKLTHLMEMMQPKAQGIRWVNPNLMHCTVKFFGEVEEKFLNESLIPVIKKEVENFPPFKLKGIGIGVFPNWRYPRVIWAGLSGDTDVALKLHGNLERSFEDMPIEKDRRAFRLHLTMGRAKAPIKGKQQLLSFIEKQGVSEYGNLYVDHLVLYRSVLSQSGSTFTVLDKFQLKGNQGRENDNQQ